ncbi:MULTISPECIES: hypothetical protein [Ensifer]|uniref:hypothetical protein n=1 Tax=Ensifer TaxID=106591 RepID=UPI000712DBAF|nr:MULTISPECIES: hypothetical protein [Ensifer]KQX23774.1 hypothetical protein ASD01_28375 [Ensifer sp. Root423]SFH46218.1 hypothetical protein SAMN05216459_13541 [Ensifer sp. OV372]
MIQDPVDSELRPVSREELYQLVWSMPVMRAAARLKVSNSYVARICSALDVPRPPRGWWTRKKFGQTLTRPPLPPPRPGRPLSWSRDAWGGSLSTYYKRRRVWQAPAGDLHPLVVLATEIFRAAKTDPTASLLVTRANNAIDVAASAETLRHALAFANTLFLALEARGHSVIVAARRRFIRPRIEIWDEPPVHCSEKAAPDLAPRWPTVAMLQDMPAGIAIVETCREAHVQYLGDGKFEPVPPKSRKGVRPVLGITWNDWQPRPAGRLKLVAYSPVHPAAWMREWQISTLRKHEREVEMILDWLEETAAQSFAAPPA